MIAYIDTSSLLKLLIEEEGSDRVEVLWRSSDTVTAAAIVVVEARAALAAAKRGRRLTSEMHQIARAELSVLVDDLAIVEINEKLISHASDLAEQEALRGYDAVHLAAALTVGADVLTSADADLCAAAARRGLHVANPLDP